MKIKTLLLLAAVALSTASCELLNNAKDTGDIDIAEGLKTALQVGKDSAVKFTSAQDGYYKDQLIMIALPPEANTIREFAAAHALGSVLNPIITNVELSMNRAAEFAAPKAKSIFGNAITNMSIGDGLTILNGKNPADSSKSGMEVGFDSLSATHFLKSKTFTQLTDSFSPPMDDALNKDVAGLGFSTNDVWSTLITNYNNAVNMANLVFPSGFNPVQNTSLGKYATGKALDGLFLKVGDQERLIRRDPYKWASSAVGDILTKVFGKK